MAQKRAQFEKVKNVKKAEKEGKWLTTYLVFLNNFCEEDKSLIRSCLNT